MKTERVYRCSNGHLFIKEFDSETKAANAGTISCPAERELFDDNGPGVMVKASCMRDAKPINLPKF